MYAAGTERPVKCAKGALYIQIFVEILFSQMAFAKDVGSKRTNEKNVLYSLHHIGNDGDYVGTT
jgi:hypothetical protein